MSRATKGARVTERQSLQDPPEGEGEPSLANRERVRRKRQVRQLGVLDGHLGYFVRRLQMWIFQDFVRALASFDIRPAQFSVLVVIEELGPVASRSVGAARDRTGAAGASAGWAREELA